jgi:hypothetical protein
MSLGGFLTGAASLFGGGGGSKGTSSSQTQNTKSSQEQAATAEEIKSGTTTQNQTSTGTSNTTGSSSQTGTTTGKEASQTTGMTTNYSSDVLASLDAILTQQLGSGSAMQASDALAGRLTQIQQQASQPAFDVNAYASGITAAATAATQNDLDSRINSILSATGSSEGGNSMSALLGAKLRNEAAANLAGISANARATGEQIKMGQQESLTGQISGLSGDLSTNLANLLAAAKGGSQQTTGTATATSSQQQQQTGTQQQATTENLSSNTQQTDKSTTQQTGLTQTTGSSKTSTNGSTKDKKGDLFDKILGAFSSSAAAA